MNLSLLSLVYRFVVAGTCALVLGFVALASACGDDDASDPTPTIAAATKAATAAPTTVAPSATPTVATTPSEEITNSFGVKLGLVKTTGAGDLSKLTLPALPEKIDKFDISDPTQAGNTVLRLGIIDGVVLAPADLKVTKIEKMLDTTLGAESFRMTLLLADSRGLFLWAAGDAVFQVKEGDTVVRGSILFTENARLSGTVGQGYATLVEFATGPALNGRLSLNASLWVGNRPSVYVP